MLYIVSYADPHSGYDHCRAVCRTPQEALERLCEYRHIRMQSDRHCCPADWSIWEYDLLYGVGRPVVLHSTCDLSQTSRPDLKGGTQR